LSGLGKVQAVQKRSGCLQSWAKCRRCGRGAAVFRAGKGESREQEDTSVTPSFAIKIVKEDSHVGKSKGFRV